jgi:hypothetical protein
MTMELSNVAYTPLYLLSIAHTVGGPARSAVQSIGGRPGRGRRGGGRT